MNITKLLYGIVAAAVIATTSVSAGEFKNFFAYRSFWPEFKAMKDFADIGVNTYALMLSNTFNSLGEPYCKYPPFWVWDETYLWDVVDRQFDDILKVNPDAKFICIIDINSPLWLARRLDRKYGIGGDSYCDISNSVCIKEWRELTEKMFVAYLKHVEGKFGDKVLSYMIAGGGTSEWYCSSLGRASLPKEAAWREWLKARSKPSAEVPSFMGMRRPAFEGRIFDPATQKAVLDYSQFTNDIVADAIDHFGGLARQNISSDKTIGSFYGFIPANMRGLMDSPRMFATKNLDFFGSPGGYDNRKIGMGGGIKSPHATWEKYGKGWFQEIDHRTHTYNDKLSPYVTISDYKNCENQAETSAMLKREFSIATILHDSLWCFDMWGGVFATPETMAVVKRAHEIWQKYKEDKTPVAAQAGIVIDPRSVPYMMTTPFDKLKRLLSASGAPFEIFSFEDLEHCDLSGCKILFFPHAWEMTPEKLKILKTRVFKDGRTVVFCDAFGISDGMTIDPSRVRQYTGFDYKTQGLPSKDMGGWTSVYASDSDKLSAGDVRALEGKAGVHFYTAESLPVYANERLVAVHVKDGGRKTVALPKKYKKITELYTDKVVGENTDRFEYNFASPDTAVFELKN